MTEAEPRIPKWLIWSWKAWDWTMEKSAQGVAGTERLKRYWTEGAGAAKVRWGVPGDFDRARRLLAKYVPPQMLNGLVANLHKRATGGWPGHAPGVEEAMAKAKKGR